MAKFKFKLKAIRPITVRALNGRLHNLKAGINEFEMEYSDYVSLLKALGMKPLPEHKEVKHEDSVKDAVTQSDAPGYTSEENKTDELESKVADPTFEQETLADEYSEEHVQHEADSEVFVDKSEAKIEEHTADERNKEPDYYSMSYTKLKAEYKKITGKNCRLKKDELIQFLQEHKDA
jgi:hypothetical protein